jgi:hypothetical protein
MWSYYASMPQLIYKYVQIISFSAVILYFSILFCIILSVTFEVTSHQQDLRYIKRFWLPLYILLALRHCLILFWIFGWHQWVWSPFQPCFKNKLFTNFPLLLMTLNITSIFTANKLYFFGLAKWVWAELNIVIHPVYIYP